MVEVLDSSQVRGGRRCAGVRDFDGTRYWGRYGAAGLLVRAPLPGGEAGVLLQHRALWTNQGGTWGLPGGARDSHETPAVAAIREAGEEAGLRAEDLRIRSVRVTTRAENGWTYTTVLADAAEPLSTRANRESVELLWVPESAVARRRLHPGFALSWPHLRAEAVAMAESEAEYPLPYTVDRGGKGIYWYFSEAVAACS